MGHRHVFSPSYMFETENDQRWNLTEHPYANIAQSGGGAESSSLAYTADNMSIDGAQYVPHCNPTPTSDNYTSLPNNVQTPHHQDPAGPPDLPTDPSSVRSFYTVPENHRNTAPSSSNTGHPIHDDNSFDIRTNNARWQYKRKINYDVGSSSEISMPTNPWEENSDIDFLHTRWDYPNAKTGSVGGESSVRNVRSRSVVDLEVNLTTTTPLTDDLSRDYYRNSGSVGVSSSGHVLGQSPNESTREWNPIHMPSAVHDSSSLSHEMNPFLIGSSDHNTSAESSGHNNGLATRSAHLPRNYQNAPGQSIRSRSNYIERSTPTFRASSSSLRLGHAVASDDPRPSSTVAWRPNDRNGRPRISIERFRSFSNEANFHDRPTPQGLIVDRTAFYGTRNPFDHHRNMRLDIDDMSYEELLALGERIGSVSTGLSEDMISKCLRETIYCSSDQIQEEGTCVICLEEYANMDDVGMLKGCKHDFHVGCIKKWLSMKNLCPICKSEPVKHKY